MQVVLSLDLIDAVLVTVVVTLHLMFAIGSALVFVIVSVLPDALNAIDELS